MVATLMLISLVVVVMAAACGLVAALNRMIIPTVVCGILIGCGAAVMIILTVNY